MARKQYNKSGNVGIFLISQPFMLGKDLTRAINWAECTRSHMADYMGVSRQTIHNWENLGERELPPMVQRDVYRILQMEKLVGGQMVSALD